MGDEIVWRKDTLNYLLNKYELSEEDYTKFINDNNSISSLSKEDIIKSVSITSKMEYEDDMTLNLTEHVLTNYLNNNIDYDPNNMMNKRIMNVYNAYNKLNNTLYSKLNNMLLLDIHGKLLNGFIDKAPGEIRDKPVFIKDGSYIHEFVKVENLLSELSNFIDLFNSINKNLDKISLARIACKIKSEFVRIHPFLDGNGRTSRMLFQKLLIELGLLFTNFNNWIREDYHKVMNLAVEGGNTDILLKFYIYIIYIIQLI